MENIQHYVIFVIHIVNICIGLYVLYQKPKSLASYAFLIFIAGVAAWSTGISSLYITHNFAFDKLALGGGFVLLLGVYLFANSFPAKTSSRGFLVTLLPLLVAALLLPFNVYIAGIRIDAKGLIEPINGPLFPLFVLIVIGYVSASVRTLYRSFRAATGITKLQIQFIGLGVFIFLSSLLIFNALLPLFGIYQLNLLGPASSVIFTTFTAYALIRHQLMDIRIAIQRGVLYTCTGLVLISAYILTLVALSNLIPDEHLATQVSAGIILLVGVFAFPQLERVFKNVTNSFFFKRGYIYMQALEELSVVLNTHNRITKLINACAEKLSEIIEPTEVIFSRTAQNDLNQYPASIPIYLNGKVFGTFLLGPKRSGDAYTAEDRILLRTFGAQAPVAFQKALLFERQKRHSQELEETVASRTRHLEELHLVQRQFVDDVSHALQTPLTILKSALETTRKGSIQIDRSVDDMSRLIRDLLALARLDAPTTPSDTVTCDLQSLLEGIAQYVHVLCRAHDITLTHTLQTKVSISGDSKQLEEAITNILSNAVRYTNKSEEKRIHISLLTNDVSIIIRISDTGPGIDQERLPHIFTRLYRAQEHEGSGLGLAITKRIVERHNGTLSAESVPLC
ncbi:ATP-binding protein, partial [Patescibacteria group bacterium]|nr:ATP-binding protein [Patescibacteria group bacterium]MBU1755031.1 ATP-binding protein [Patescibacteria group bacterium]